MKIIVPYVFSQVVVRWISHLHTRIGQKANAELSDSLSYATLFLIQWQYKLESKESTTSAVSRSTCINMSKASRFTLSQVQLDQYFDRIALPPSKRIYDVSSLSDEEKLAFLKILLKHQQVRVPFENLTQHYSWHRVIDPRPRHVFRKVIDQPGRGGYCMENNTLFHTVILSLGFNCYVAGGRVAIGPGQWTGWSHLVNLITIGGIKYLCDVGFGSNEPIHPMPLHHDTVRPQISPAESRLVFETIPEYLSDTKLWIVQFRFDAELAWTNMYAFTETELLPTDIPDMNYSPWISRTSPFIQNIMCVRFTTDKEVDGDALAATETVGVDQIDGTLVIDNNRLKWRRHGKNVLDVEFKSENDRVEALKKYWGIDLDIEDREAIYGTANAVKGI